MDSTVDETPSTLQPSPNEWTLVTRRRRPLHFQPSSLSPPKQARIYNPHSPTYAQVLQQPITAGHSLSNVPLHSPQPVSPKPKYVRPPNSPTNLPYPSNPYQKEWWGRCFRCAQKGHVVAQCTFPRMPGTAPNPDQNSRGPNPPTVLRPSAMPFSPAHQPRLSIFKSRVPEPGFDELLAESEPSHTPHLPPDRPKRAICYFNRDRQYFDSLQNSLKGIVVQSPPTLAGQLSLDKVAELLASSTKIVPSQLQAAWLSRDRVLIILPPSLNRDEVISAILRTVWDDGFTFHSYSPHIDAAISIPCFKVWIDLCGVPLHFCSEAHLARAVSSFGTYLGSMEPKKLSDVQNWSLFIATDNLALIPHELEIRAGGLVNTVTVCPKKWIQNPVYHRIDLPPMMISYQPPLPSPSRSDPPLSARQSVPHGDSIGLREEDVMPVSVKLLREFFKDVPRSHLPEDLAACLDGDREVLQANQASYHSSEQHGHRAAPRGHPPSLRTTHAPATMDPVPSTSEIPNPANHASLQPTRPYSTSPALIERPQPATPTVHRTETHENQQGRMLPDLSFEVCSNVSYRDRLDTNRNNWDPHLLFPELRTASNQNGSESFIAHRTNPSRGQKAIRNVPPTHPLRRTTRGRINKKTTAQAGFGNLEATDFVDVPLQYAEDRQLLNLIGAENVPIPSNLMDRAPRATDGPPSSSGPSHQHLTLAPQQPSPLGLSDLLALHNAGPSNPNNPQYNPRTARPRTSSTYHQAHCQDPNLPAVPLTQPLPPPDNELPQLDDINDDDPYLDRVDYSEEDYDVVG